MHSQTLRLDSSYLQFNFFVIFNLVFVNKIYIFKNRIQNSTKPKKMNLKIIEIAKENKQQKKRWVDQ